MTQDCVLLIRRAQLEVFDRHLREQRVDDHCAAVRMAWPEACAALDAEALRARVAEAVEAARAHGFTNGEQEARFLHLSFFFGSDLGAQPWAVAILAWSEDSATRLGALEKRVAIEVERRGSA